MRVFGNERVVFWREAGMNLDMFAYFLAKNVVELPRLALLTFFFVMSFYPLVAPNMEWYYYFYYSFAASFACSGFSYFASIALSPLKAQLLVVIYVLVGVMFNGTTTRLSDLSHNLFFNAISYLSYARWLCELCYLRQIYNLSFAWRLPPNFYLKPSVNSALYGLIMLEYTPTDKSMMLDMIMLLLLGFAFRCFAFISMIVFNRDKKGLPPLCHPNLTCLSIVKTVKTWVNRNVVGWWDICVSCYLHHCCAVDEILHTKSISTRTTTTTTPFEFTECNTLGNDHDMMVGHGWSDELSESLL